jgi:NADH dehydrogenase FAD-containing subunit
VVQVAGQQGAFVARTINRNLQTGRGGFGPDCEAPFRTVEAAKGKQYEHEFEFLSLGIMAYIGRNRAIMQVDMDTNLNIWGQFAFLLWRSVYITKQVSMRNRVLILFDWLKTRVFGRDISLF